MHCAFLFLASWSVPGQVNICYHLPDGQVVKKLISTPELLCKLWLDSELEQ